MSLPEPETALPAPVRLEPDGAFPSLRFDNSFVRELPGEAEMLRAVRGVRGACFSPIAPVAVSAPKLVASSPEVARSLDLSEAACASETFLQVFAGNAPARRAWSRTPPVTAGISSAAGPGSSATGGPSAWARS